jgi:hypothetical protein
LRRAPTFTLRDSASMSIGASHIFQPDGDRGEIVGVVGDVRNSRLNRPTQPEIYLLASGREVNPMEVVVRSATAPASARARNRRCAAAPISSR